MPSLLCPKDIASTINIPFYIFADSTTIAIVLIVARGDTRGMEPEAEGLSEHVGLSTLHFRRSD